MPMDPVATTRAEQAVQKVLLDHGCNPDAAVAIATESVRALIDDGWRRGPAIATPSTHARPVPPPRELLDTVREQLRSHRPTDKDGPHT